MNFEGLLSEVSRDDFMRQFWEREPLYVPAQQCDRYASVLGMDDVDEFLSRGDLREPALRMMLDGAPVDRRAYTTTITLGEHRSSDWIQSDKVLAHYRLGATIIMQLAHYSVPRLRAFSAQLQSDLGFNNEMNVYLTPPGKQGFAAHYDTHSVLVLQIKGTKQWTLYGRTHQMPLLNERFSVAKHKPGAITREITLSPGDLLYVPRGVYHSAAAQEGHSLHITVGLFPPTWLDIAKFRLNALAAKDDMRQSAFGCRPASLNDLLPDIPQSQLLREHAFATYDGQAQVTRGRLNDLLRLAQPISTLAFLKREGVNVLRTDGSDTIDLRCCNATVRLPTLTAPLLNFILQAVVPFTVDQLPDVVDRSGKEAFVTRMVEEGVLSIV